MKPHTHTKKNIILMLDIDNVLLNGEKSEWATVKKAIKKSFSLDYELRHIDEGRSSRARLKSINNIAMSRQIKLMCQTLTSTKTIWKFVYHVAEFSIFFFISVDEAMKEHLLCIFNVTTYVTLIDNLWAHCLQSFSHFCAVFSCLNTKG